MFCCFTHVDLSRQTCCFVPSDLLFYPLWPVVLFRQTCCFGSFRSIALVPQMYCFIQSYSYVNSDQFCVPSDLLQFDVKYRWYMLSLLSRKVTWPSLSSPQIRIIRPPPLSGVFHVDLCILKSMVYEAAMTGIWQLYNNCTSCKKVVITTAGSYLSLEFKPSPVLATAATTAGEVPVPCSLLGLTCRIFTQPLYSSRGEFQPSLSSCGSAPYIHKWFVSLGEMSH